MLYASIVDIRTHVSLQKRGGGRMAGPRSSGGPAGHLDDRYLRPWAACESKKEPSGGLPKMVLIAGDIAGDDADECA